MGQKRFASEPLIAKRREVAMEVSRGQAVAQEVDDSLLCGKRDKCAVCPHARGEHVLTTQIAEKGT